MQGQIYRLAAPQSGSKTVTERRNAASTPVFQISDGANWHLPFRLACRHNLVSDNILPAETIERFFDAQRPSNCPKFKLMPDFLVWPMDALDFRE